ncbi:MAG: MinD/ParA family protein [Brevinema sp.]
MSTHADTTNELKHLINQENSRTRIITITSGKGGVGKSNFALNLAITIANQKDPSNPNQRRRVVIMDADLGLANVNVLLGLIPKLNLYHVLKGQKSLKEIIIPTSFGIDLIAGASGLSQLANLTEEERLHFIKEIAQLNYADYLIIDTAAGVSSNVTQFAAIAHDTIVITTPEPTSITDAYGVIKSIALDHHQIPNLKLVVNRVSSQKEAEKVASKIISISKGFLNLDLSPLGYIPDSPIVSAAVRKQIPFTILNPGSNVAQGIEQIAQKLMNIDYQPDGNAGWKNFLTYLLGND